MNPVIKRLLEMPESERKSVLAQLTAQERAMVYRELLSIESAPQRHWYCPRDTCDGNPHAGFHWCEHPINDVEAHKSYCKHARTPQRPPYEDPDDPYLSWLYMGGRGTGKLLALDTPVPTPFGWTTMGELRVGHVVFDEVGRVCNVTATFDELPERAYRLTFSDGSTIVAGGEHQWVTWRHHDREAYVQEHLENSTRLLEGWPTWTQSATTVGPRIRTTDEIVATLTHGEQGDYNHSIPVSEPLQLPDISLPIDPYVLGVWLGSGSRASGYFTGTDEEVWKEIEAANLWANKHIPATYLRASAGQRLALLQGLMDTAGGWSRPTVEFHSANKALVDSVMELARSLGQQPVAEESHATLYGENCGPTWRVTWTPTIQVFRVAHKDLRLHDLQMFPHLHRMIVSAESLAPEPMRCITVDSPNSMYLVGEGMVPTHNTRSGAEWVLDLVWNKGFKRIALVGTTPADVRDVMVWGEALALDTPVPTPTGWTTMGEIKEGDTIIGGDGQPCRVTHAFPVLYNRPCYEVQLKGGGSVVADASHKWLTEDVRYRRALSDGDKTKFAPRVVTTEDMRDTLYKQEGVRGQTSNHAIRLPKYSEFGFGEPLPIDPYVLGAWLGDGSLGTGEIVSADPEIVERIASAGYKVVVHPSSEGRGVARQYGIDQLRGQLRTLGVLMNKHIPMTYLRASREDRLALLQGLMDTDGSISASGRCEYMGKNLTLVRGVQELAASLGIRVSTIQPKWLERHGQHHYRVRFTTTESVFHLSRKAQRVPARLRDEGYRHVGGVRTVQSVPVRCIAVESPDHTFMVTEYFLPTHNSGIMECSEPNERPKHEPTKRRLVWPNGAMAFTYSSYAPSNLRGPQHDAAWGDEIAAWADAAKGDAEGTTYNNLVLGLRLGENPKVMLTTTPKRVKLVQDLVKRHTTAMTTGTTYENLSNLAKPFQRAVLEIYENTRIGKQELEGILLDDVEGAMFRQENIDSNRAQWLQVRK